MKGMTPSKRGNTAFNYHLPEWKGHGHWMKAQSVPGLVSVIVPTHNRAHLVQETLDSVAAQDYRPIELVVVDDGSTDHSLRVISEWVGAHSNEQGLTTVVVPNTKQGAAAARNRGLVVSRGEFIQFLDSDDLLSRGKISAQVRSLAPLGGQAAVYGPCRLFRKRKRGGNVYSGYRRRPGGDQLLQWIRRGGLTVPHTILWRRTDVLRLGRWNESLVADDDGEYGMRFLAQGGRLVYRPGSWAYYRTDSGDRTSQRNTRETLFSRIEVAALVEQQLSSTNRLSAEFRAALAARYYGIARRAAMRHADIASLCLKEILRLLPRTLYSKELLYFRLGAILGLNHTEILARLLKSVLRVRLSQNA